MPVDLSLFPTETDSKPQVESEDNRICHQVRDGKSSHHPHTSRHDMVIVGGGVSGLTAAYLLQPS